MTQLAPVPAMQMSLDEYQRTMVGRQLLATQRKFAYGGQVWVGFQGEPYQCHDMLLTAEELAEMFDIDGTKASILARIDNTKRTQEARARREWAERKSEILKAREDMLKILAEQKERGEVDPELIDCLRDLEIIQDPNRPSPSPPSADALRRSTGDPLVRIVKDGGDTPVGEISEEQFQLPHMRQTEHAAPVDDGRIDKLQTQVSELTATVSTLVNALLPKAEQPVEAVTTPPAERESIEHTEVASPHIVAVPDPEPTEAAPPAPPTPDPADFGCPTCGKACPADHKNPPLWRQGHMSRAHRSPKK